MPVRVRQGLSKTQIAAIRSLPPKFTLSDLRRRGFLVHRERFRGRRIEIFSSPLVWVNPRARVVVVGITPGWRQTKIAFQAARTALREGRSGSEACRRAQYEASFAGPMRKNLVSMYRTLCLGPPPEIKRLFESLADLARAG